MWCDLDKCAEVRCKEVFYRIVSRRGDVSAFRSFRTVSVKVNVYAWCKRFNTAVRPSSSSGHVQRQSLMLKSFFKTEKIDSMEKVFSNQFDQVQLSWFF